MATVPAVIGRASSITLDILFPPTCAVCESDGAWFCDDCQRRIGLNLHRFHEPTWPFASVIACGSYANPVLRQALTTFKYRSAACLAEDWKGWLKRFRGTFLDPWPWAGLSELIVTSIPGDARRIRRRNLDHATLLADVVRDVIVPWAERADLLERTRHIAPNANLPATELRRINVQQAFRAKTKIDKPVLLVDDVLTTGATAIEAAKTLLAAGATEVHLFALARG